MHVPPTSRLEALSTAIDACHADRRSPAWRALAQVVRTAAFADPAVSGLWPPDEGIRPERTRRALRRLARELDALASRDAGTRLAVTSWLRHHGAAPPEPPPASTANVVGGTSVIHGPSVQARDIHGLHFHLPPGADRPRHPVPRQLPPVTAQFVDREHDRHVLDTLRAQRPAHAPQLLVVSGLPGVGKTALAAHWLHGHAHDFPDGTLYADLGGHAADDDSGPVSPGTVLERFLIALGAPSVPADTAGRSALWRSLTSGLRIAVLLDNAFTAAQVRPLLPGTPTGLTVVTSRSNLTGLRVDGASVHRMEGLPAESAVELLAVGGGARVTRESAAAHEVVRLCGRLPLTVCLASAQLAVRPHRSVSALAEALSGTRGAVDTLRIEGEAVMGTALDLSYGLLPEESAVLYRRMGLLPTDHYDLHLLAAVADGGHRTSGGASGTAAIDTAAIDTAVHALLEANLLEETGAGSYRFHDLVQSHARRRGEAEEGEDLRGRVLHAFVDWCLATAAVAEAILTPSHRMPEHGAAARTVAPTPLAGPEEALAWLDTHRNGLMSALRHCAEAGLDTSCWRLADLIWPLFLRFRPTDMWIEAHRLGLDAARRSGSRAGEGRMLTSGAIGLRDAGRYAEAADWYRQARELALADGDVRQEAQALNGLGHIALLTRRLDDARRHFDKALRLRESIGYRRGVALTRRRLAETALAASDLGTAVRHLRQARAELESLEERYEAARVRALLGHVLERSGEHEEAAHHLREALVSFRAGAARSEHWEGRTLVWLAEAAETRGDTVDAVAHYEAARDLLRRVSPDHAERVDRRLRQL
ncbi:tetratricopeptide repeat protein [Streptomyces sp. NPDC088766]|uniref:tetratricopeptide repeat protein n=1 Tax=Streptomyces sp. NPDC088766 TaxID=3365893 RepID=UPI00382D4905